AASFSVNAVPSPPTAPKLSSPADNAVVDLPRPTLSVTNATSHDGLPLTYSFEVFLVGSGGTLDLVAQVAGVPEGAATTSWVLPVDLKEGLSSWRAGAADPFQTGPWMTSAFFRVQIDVPPQPPAGLQAAPGDRRVTLTWTASPEPDVVGYRVYRGTAAGG